MHQRSFVALVGSAGRSGQLAAVASLLLGSFVLSTSLAATRLPGSDTAIWWPAAGLSVIAAIVARRRLLTVVAVAVVTAGANALAGTDLLVSVGFGLLNGAEAWIVATLVTAGPPARDRLGFRAVARLLLAALAGAAVAGVAAALVVGLLAGGPPLATALSAFASHLSAVLLLVPLALLPGRAFTTTRAGEFVVQAALLIALTIIAFFPGWTVPLTFLPFAAIAWATFRFETGLVAVELIVTAALATVLTFLGGGSFVQEQTSTTIALLELFVVSLAVSALLLSGVQNDRADALRRARAREALLSGGIVSAGAGFLVVQPDSADRLVILEANPVAERTFARRIVREPDGTRVLRADDGLRDGIVRVLWSATPRWTTVSERSDGTHLRISVAQVDGSEDAPVLVVETQDVTERVRTELALKSALAYEVSSAAELRELNRQKDVFLSSVSHELRTPVASIIGYAEMLDPAALPEADRGTVEVILRNATRLVHLIENLLEVSRLERGAERGPVETVDLAALVAECLDEVAPLARDADVALVRTVPADPVTRDTVRADVQRIVLNLLTNAIKFTPAGGRVEASVLPGTSPRIAVADTGVGIGPEELAHVFDRFYRTSTATTLAVPGTGLGLAIVRTLAERLGAAIDIRSDGVSGTTAELVFDGDPATP